jgi:hypothetical protein
MKIIGGIETSIQQINPEQGDNNSEISFCRCNMNLSVIDCSDSSSDDSDSSSDSSSESSESSNSETDGLFLETIQQSQQVESQEKSQVESLALINQQSSQIFDQYLKSHILSNQEIAKLILFQEGNELDKPFGGVNVATLQYRVELDEINQYLNLQSSPISIGIRPFQLLSSLSNKDTLSYEVPMIGDPQEFDRTTKIYQDGILKRAKKGIDLLEKYKIENILTYDRMKLSIDKYELSLNRIDLTYAYYGPGNVFPFSKELVLQMNPNIEVIDNVPTYTGEKPILAGKYLAVYQGRIVTKNESTHSSVKVCNNYYVDGSDGGNWTFHLKIGKDNEGNVSISSDGFIFTTREVPSKSTLWIE